MSLREINPGLPQSVGQPSWLLETNRLGAVQWRASSWPDRKTEHWKYTSLRAVEQGEFFGNGSEQSVSGVDAQESDLARLYSMPSAEVIQIVFVNGRFSAALSTQNEVLPGGVSLTSFGKADSEQSAIIRQHLNTVVDAEKHIFAALNNQCLQDGVLLHLEKNTRLDLPVQAVWLTTSTTSSFHVAQRLLVVLEAQSEATVIEQYVSEPWVQRNFTFGVSELILKDAAKLHHYRLHLEHETALHVGGVHAALERDAELNSFHLATGSTLKRIDAVVNYRGENGHCFLNGVYLPRNSQHIDYHTNIEHCVPRCTTREIFRGIIADQARAVFNGRIHIHPQAQKTLAQLSNKNLLTSNRAEVDTKPELEIYADDVQCAHGATVAQLDADALYYFLTRGIAEDEARVMLSFGFINELINMIEHRVVADYLKPMLAEFFARDPHLMRHIAQ